MMWRAFFLAIGVSLCILGLECMVVEAAVLGQDKAPAAATGFAPPANEGEKKSREIRPPEWAPWSLLSAGAVIMLYSFTIPRRVGK